MVLIEAITLSVGAFAGDHEKPPIPCDKLTVLEFRELNTVKIDFLGVTPDGTYDLEGHKSVDAQIEALSSARDKYQKYKEANVNDKKYQKQTNRLLEIELSVTCQKISSQVIMQGVIYSYRLILLC